MGWFAGYSYSRSQPSAVTRALLIGQLQAEGAESSDRWKLMVLAGPAMSTEPSYSHRDAVARFLGAGGDRQFLWPRLEAEGVVFERPLLTTPPSHTNEAFRLRKLRDGVFLLKQESIIQRYMIFNRVVEP